MLAALSYGDAIGNEALRIQEILRGRGHDSEIFAESVHPEMAGRARKLWDYRTVASAENVLILHFSIGAGVSTFAYHLPDRILLVYHNITPARWFASFHPHLAGLCYHGRRELQAYVVGAAVAGTLRWIEEYGRSVGPPVYEDEDLCVFDLREAP